VITLGVDAICWHSRFAAGEVTFEEVLTESAELGVSFVQANLHYLGDGSDDDRLAALAGELGLIIHASGSALGRRYHGGSVEAAVAAARSELARAKNVGSPEVMFHSGVYLPETAGRPDEERAELEHLGAVLDLVAAEAEAAGVVAVLENASDFRTDVLDELIGARHSDWFGMFLDLNNAYNVFEDAPELIRRLGPYSSIGHVKDFALESLWTEDEYHRRAFQLAFRYPGEGIADLPLLLGTLMETIGERDFLLSIEGLDSHAGVDDQRQRLGASLELLADLLGEKGEQLSAG
jgi:sugar phosphate isomerase/epimerase